MCHAVCLDIDPEDMGLEIATHVKLSKDDYGELGST